MSLATFTSNITGRLGQDAKVRSHKDWFAISFSIAISEKRQDGNYVTTWINCTYWSKSDKIATYLTKGKLITAVSDWFETSEKDGKTYNNFRIKDINPFLERNEPIEVATTHEENPEAAHQNNVIADDDEDDLPF